MSPLRIEIVASSFSFRCIRLKKRTSERQSQIRSQINSSKKITNKKYALRHSRIRRYSDDTQLLYLFLCLILSKLNVCLQNGSSCHPNYNMREQWFLIRVPDVTAHRSKGRRWCDSIISRDVLLSYIQISVVFVSLYTLCKIHVTMFAIERAGG